jgi:hypothetical protein
MDKEEEEKQGWLKPRQLETIAKAGEGLSVLLASGAILKWFLLPGTMRAPAWETVLVVIWAIISLTIAVWIRGKEV